jgi:hypothetical protein
MFEFDSVIFLRNESPNNFFAFLLKMLLYVEFLSEIWFLLCFITSHQSLMIFYITTEKNSVVLYMAKLIIFEATWLVDWWWQTFNKKSTYILKYKSQHHSMRLNIYFYLLKSQKRVGFHNGSILNTLVYNCRIWSSGVCEFCRYFWNILYGKSAMINHTLRSIFLIGWTMHKKQQDVL